MVSWKTKDFCLFFRESCSGSPMAMLLPTRWGFCGARMMCSARIHVLLPPRPCSEYSGPRNFLFKQNKLAPSLYLFPGMILLMDREGLFAGLVWTRSPVPVCVRGSLCYRMNPGVGTEGRWASGTSSYQRHHILVWDLESKNSKFNLAFQNVIFFKTGG